MLSFVANLLHAQCCLQMMVHSRTATSPGRMAITPCGRQTAAPCPAGMRMQPLAKADSPWSACAVGQSQERGQAIGCLLSSCIELPRATFVSALWAPA